MSVRRALARSLGVLVLTGPFTASLVLAETPAAQAAASDFTSPAAGQVFTGTQSPVTVAANVPACPKNVVGGCSSTPTTTLSVSSAAQSLPSASKQAKTSVQTVSVTVPASAPNGSWTATLSGGNTGTRTFTINYDPNAPGSFSATGSGAREVSFLWTKGSEPDLTGYTLTDGSGSVIATGITPASAGCASSSRCSYGKYYDTDYPGTHDYRLIANRSAAGGGTLSSQPATAQATLTVPPKPTASPTPAPTQGGAPATGGSGGTPAGSSGGGTGGGAPAGGSSASGGGSAGNPGAKPTLPPNAIAQPRTFAPTFRAFSPSLGIPKLPPLPSTTMLPALEQPLPVGTYKPSLPYSPKSETTKTTSVLTQPIHFVSNVLDSKQLARSLAGALILLLIGAHLRRFLGTHAEE